MEGQRRQKKKMERKKKEIPLLTSPSRKPAEQFLKPPTK
jgi:hypothetical protein